MVLLPESITYFDTINICTMDPIRLLGGLYFSPIGCEVALVAFQLFHAYLHAYRVKDATPLLRVLYADGFLYFLLVAALRLWSAFNVCVPSPPSLPSRLTEDW